MPKLVVRTHTTHTCVRMYNAEPLTQLLTRALSLQRLFDGHVALLRDNEVPDLEYKTRTEIAKLVTLMLKPIEEDWEKKVFATGRAALDYSDGLRDGIEVRPCMYHLCVHI